MPAPLPQPVAGGDYMRHVIDQQMQLMAQQLALLSGGAAGAAAPAMAAPAPLAATAPAAVAEPQPTDDAAPKAVDDEEAAIAHTRSEEHTSELQSLMRISYAVFCLKKKKKNN